MPNTSERERASRLLIVEDDPLQLRTLSSILKKEGFDVIACATAAEALEHVASADVGVAVVDMRLPDLSGTQLLEKIQALNGRIRVIINTGYGSFDSAKEAVNLGAFAYVEKAGSPGELIRHVHAAARWHLDRYAKDLEEAVAERTTELRQANEELRTEIAERERAEDELAIASRMRTALLDNIPDCIALILKKGTREIVACNDRAREAGAVAGQTCFKTCALRDDNCPFCLAPTLWETGQPQRLEVEHRGVWYDGIWEPLSEDLYVHYIFDITKRKRAETALRESRERFKLLYERAPIAYQSLDERGHFLEVNQAWLDVLGYDRKEVIGRWFGDFLSPESVEHFKRSFPCFKAEGEIHRVRFQMIKKDGSQILVEYDGKIGFDEFGEFEQTHCVLQDITERQRAEEEKDKLEAQLRQSQKMEAIGQLAGGVAHDFNNLLTVILGNADLLLARVSRSPAALQQADARTNLEDIKAAGYRAAALTQQLLVFSRKQTARLEVIDLRRLVGEVEKMLRRLIREDIALDVTVAPGIGRIRADAGQIEQTIINLVLNARDAMPHGGRLTVVCENVTLDAAHAAAHPGAKVGPHVRLLVRDTGVGMDADTMDHMFEPFFTTKPVGQGTGLGLSTVYGTVTQAGGHITATSDPGVGTTFFVHFPAVDEPLDPSAPLEPIRELGGDEVVLVCEDEPLVRSVTCYTLRSAGYTVLEAENGKRALEVWAEHTGSIDLLVTDVVMPVMNGPELVQAIRAQQPDLRVVFVSGHAADVLQDEVGSGPRQEFLQKPYTPTQLLRQIRELLDQPKATAGKP